MNTVSRLEDKKSSDKAKKELVNEFIDMRRNEVLIMVPSTISLQALTERLRLNFKQIKQLYDSKVKTFKNNLKYLKLAEGLQEKELLKQQLQYYS